MAQPVYNKNKEIIYGDSNDNKTKAKATKEIYDKKTTKKSDTKEKNLVIVESPAYKS